MSQPDRYLTRVRELALGAPTRPALSTVRDDGVDLWTYGAVWGSLCRGSERLAAAGIRSGQRLGILGETEPAWGIAELAALHRGAVAVPLDLNHPDGVLRAILEDSGAAGLLASRTQAERGRSLMRGHPTFVFDELFDRSRDAASDMPPEPIDPDHPRLLVYTSGTTGTPKGVTLTERNLTAQLDAILQVIPVTAEDSLLSILPLNHMYAQIMNLLGPLYVGARVQFAAEATPQAVRLVLERGNVTAFGAVPQFFALFRDRVLSEIHRRGKLAVRVHDLLVWLSRAVRACSGRSVGHLLFPAIHRAFGGRLRWVVAGGAYLDPELARQYVDWGFSMLAAYGLTEATAAVTVTPPHAVDMATVGRPLPGVELRIDRPDDRGIGEILVRGPILMAGYWQRPDATREVIDTDGWLHTGDLGYCDPRGNVVISGRAKEMIVLASRKNVFPQELDDHYAGHPLIQEVCVVGLPDSGGGERLHAVVVPDLDEFRRRGIPTVEDYVRFEMETLALELPSYQRVRSYTISREALPRTPTRKVRRFEVRDRLLSMESAGPVTTRSFEWEEADRDLLESETMQAVLRAGRLRERGANEIHPDMNLEFDLGLDSLARAEMIAHLSASHDVDPDALASALTLREMVRELDAAGHALAPGTTGPAKVSWSRLLDDPRAAAEARRQLEGSIAWRNTASIVIGLGLKVIARTYFGLRVFGADQLPRARRPFIMAVNHLSFGDAFLVAAALPHAIRRDVFFIGYAGHVEGGLRGLGSRALNVISVDAGRRLTRALQLGAAGLRLGRILMIFPEGERTVDGRLRPFKLGTALLIRETGAPVVPVGLVGAFESWGRDRRRPRPGRVTVAFGAPMEFTDAITDDEDADLERITAELRSRVAELVIEHGGPAPAETVASRG